MYCTHVNTLDIIHNAVTKYRKQTIHIDMQYIVNIYVYTVLRTTTSATKTESTLSARRNCDWQWPHRITKTDDCFYNITLPCTRSYFVQIMRTHPIRLRFSSHKCSVSRQRRCHHLLRTPPSATWMELTLRNAQLCGGCNTEYILSVIRALFAFWSVSFRLDRPISAKHPNNTI